MKQTLNNTVGRYTMAGAPYELRPVTESTMRAIAARIRQVAEYFEANPRMRAKGTLTDGRKVCAIGAVEYSRKIGLKWDPTASRNCNSHLTMNVMDSMGIVIVNDSTVPAEQFLSYMRFCADVLDAYAVTGDWAGSVNKQPLAKRLKLNIPTPVSA